MSSPRGPQIVGTCGESYALAINLWNAAHDHKKHCSENCNVSLSLLAEAATRVMEHGATIREWRDFMKWKWPDSRETRRDSHVDAFDSLRRG